MLGKFRYIIRCHRLKLCLDKPTCYLRASSIIAYNVVKTYVFDSTIQNNGFKIMDTTIQNNVFEVKDDVYPFFFCFKASIRNY